MKQLEATQKLATETTSTELKTRLLELSLQMKRDGNADKSITEYARTLKQLIKLGADLYNPESVKDVIANQKTWSNRSKRLVTVIYDKFAKFVGLEWTRPAYKFQPKKPYIPLEKDLDVLIAYCGKTVSTFLQVLKETGARSGETLRLKWQDIDFEQRKIYVNNAEKNSECRIIKVSQKLTGMLQSMPHKPDQDRIFSSSDVCMRVNFSKQRKRATNKMQNPNLPKIHLHTFRHWKATTEYHKTRNILHVMKLLGHRNIQNTLLYTQLIENTEDDQFYFATAKNEAEAHPLIEKSFEYVATTPQGVMLFRKRK